jgi:molybdate transport system ATP-binding protein
MSTAHSPASNGNSVAMRYSLNRDDFSLDVDISVPTHGITGIFGASGSGKTTLLRCIAGLEQGIAGHFSVNGEVWHDSDRGISIPVHQRRIGYVFQEARLFSHLSVRGNLHYGMNRNKDQADQVEFDQIIKLLGLERLLDRKPASLSGGEAQRVAIARALLRSPSLVLMDEPLAALDSARKEEILPFLDKLHAELSLPILYVSHSMEEVCRLCDHLVVMDQGRVLAQGGIQSVLVRLDLPAAASEIAGTVIAGKIAAYDPDYDLTSVDFSGGRLLIPGACGALSSPLRLRIRASDISLCRERPNETTILNVLPVTIEGIQSDQGPFCMAQLRAGEDLLTARITRQSAETLGIKTGDTLLAQIKSVAVRNSPV